MVINSLPANSMLQLFKRTSSGFQNTSSICNVGITVINLDKVSNLNY